MNEIPRFREPRGRVRRDRLSTGDLSSVEHRSRDCQLARCQDAPRRETEVGPQGCVCPTKHQLEGGSVVGVVELIFARRRG